MKTQICFVFLAILCSIGRGQECLDQMVKFHNCMAPKNDGMMDKVKACFDNNDCKMPDHGPPKEGGSSSTGGKDIGQCIGDKAKPIMEQCLQSKGIPIPKLPGGGPMGHGPGGPMGGGAPPPVPDSCAKADDVRQCIYHIMPSSESLQKTLQKICDDKKKCLAEVSQPCQDVFKNAKTKACECATEKKTDFSSAINDCFNGNAPPMADMMIQGICGPDPCDGGFQRGPFPGPPPQGGGPFPGPPPAGGNW